MDQKKLWIAVVEHTSEPGTKPALFFAATEPSDRAIKARFAASAKPSELVVTDIYNVSHVADHDEASMAALREFVAANTSSK